MTLLQIFVPLTSVLTVIIVLAIILSRRSGLCKKLTKRHGSNVIKASDDVQLLDRMNAVNKNPTYLSSIHDGTLAQKLAVKEIPIEHVHILESVGEGAFGQVFRGQYSII